MLRNMDNNLYAFHNEHYTNTSTLFESKYTEIGYRRKSKHECFQKVNLRSIGIPTIIDYGLSYIKTKRLRKKIIIQGRLFETIKITADNDPIRDATKLMLSCLLRRYKENNSQSVLSSGEVLSLHSDPQKGLFKDRSALFDSVEQSELQKVLNFLISILFDNIPPDKVIEYYCSESRNNIVFQSALESFPSFVKNEHNKSNIPLTSKKHLSDLIDKIIIFLSKGNHRWILYEKDNIESFSQHSILSHNKAINQMYNIVFVDLNTIFNIVTVCSSDKFKHCLLDVLKFKTYRLGSSFVTLKDILHDNLREIVNNFMIKIKEHIRLIELLTKSDLPKSDDLYSIISSFPALANLFLSLLGLEKSLLNWKSLRINISLLDKFGEDGRLINKDFLHHLIRNIPFSLLSTCLKNLSTKLNIKEDVLFNFTEPEQIRKELHRITVNNGIIFSDFITECSTIDFYDNFEQKNDRKCRNLMEVRETIINVISDIKQIIINIFHMR